MGEQLVFCGHCYVQFPKKNTPLILCEVCKYLIHKDCNGLSNKDYKTAAHDKDDSRCLTCDLTSTGDLLLKTLMTRVQNTLKWDTSTVLN